MQILSDSQFPKFERVFHLSPNYNKKIFCQFGSFFFHFIHDRTAVFHPVFKLQVLSFCEGALSSNVLERICKLQRRQTHVSLYS